MRRVITGQILLIICCVFYLIWWYRGYRPGVSASPIGGINGVLLFITMAFGFSGVVFSLMPVPEISEPKMHPVAVIGAGIGAYLVLLLVTKCMISVPVRGDYGSLCIQHGFIYSILPDGRNESILCGYAATGDGSCCNGGSDRYYVIIFLFVKQPGIFRLVRN